MLGSRRRYKLSHRQTNTDATRKRFTHARIHPALFPTALASHTLHTTYLLSLSIATLIFYFKITLSHRLKNVAGTPSLNNFLPLLFRLSGRKPREHIFNNLCCYYLLDPRPLFTFRTAHNYSSLRARVYTRTRRPSAHPLLHRIPAIKLRTVKDPSLTPPPLTKMSVALRTATCHVEIKKRIVLQCCHGRTAQTGYS